MKAKNFSLPDQFGKIHNISDYKGKWVVLYFYPKDDTPGCTKEACLFRDNIEEYKKRGAVVIGVSKDTVESHKKFADKYRLNFTILADPEKKTIRDYGAWGEKTFMGRKFMGTMRNTYLINPKGALVKTYEKVNPLTHSGDILRDLDGLLSH
ncbi:MAG: thioredoxin-dependent thiol peroxidase [Patescibacteria group bacterium]